MVNKLKTKNKKLSKWNDERIQISVAMLVDDRSQTLTSNAKKEQREDEEEAKKHTAQT